MLYLSRHPISVADVIICVVGVKISKFNIPKRYEKIYIFFKAAKNRRCTFSICGELVCKV